MKFSILSVLTLVGAGMVSARATVVKRSDSPTSHASAAAAALSGDKVSDESATADCVGPLLCCGTLTTPLDPLVDPLLLALGIDVANIVGSIGLLCHGYEEATCETEPQCCTEANLLGGTLALGCADLKN
ncbi:Hydrophobin [Penicillium paradoxum]|uniref:Hydrophobin n=1 Tax=Penicillium paradoxum TaxID=176176 RepID=UPI0025482BC9|nr:Hydrophobin [Penicillium paradoxum]KAJ5781236.1 Hydrophobin [Penicillium paradoxum]